MNVVIYARYSSHNQHETSIEGQLKVCYEYCEKNNYTIVGEYIDRAISGKTDNRPQFLRMIEDAAKKTFDYIIVYQLDRFSRNRYDSAIYKSKLKKYGVRVLSAKENISDDASGILIESILEGMAEYYSVELAQKVKRGMDLNAEKFLSTGGNVALGFKVDKDKHFQIDEETAPIVRYIFESYASGMTVTEITQHLNEQGYKTSRGVPFNKNSLRNMLQNKRYIGTYTYNGKEFPNAIPRIVTDELFNAVAERFNKNKRAPARAKAKVEYLLTTKLFCGYCREMMVGYSGTSKTGKKHHYYTCKSALKKNCKKKLVKKDVIEEYVIQKCRELLTPENIETIAQNAERISRKDRDNSNIKMLEKQLRDIERKQENLRQILIECPIESLRQQMYEEVPKLEEAKRSVETEIAKEEIGLFTITAQQVKFFLNELKKGNPDNIKYRKALINMFVNRIYLYDDGKITFIFNSGREPVEVDAELLDKIDNENKEAESSYLEQNAPAASFPHQDLVFFIQL